MTSGNHPIGNWMDWKWTEFWRTALDCICEFKN